MKLRWLLLLCVACRDARTCVRHLSRRRRLIRIGDSVSELIDMLGEPIYKEPVDNALGGYVADRWQYRLDGKAVQFTISDGRIQRIEEIRDEQ